MPVSRAPRLALVDALRGFAVAQMIVYHFIYDLDYFGWIDLAMTRDQPGWAGDGDRHQFLLLVGLSLVLRIVCRPRGLRKRWAQVAGAALLVSLAAGSCSGPASSTSASFISLPSHC
jgi:uncharacterized membrane protein